MPRAILFDHDGVLVASEPLHWAAWNRLFSEIGIPFDENWIQTLVGKTSPQILTAALQQHRPESLEDPQHLDRLVHRKNELYMIEAQSGLKPYPGVREGLEWLKANGIRAAVVSNARRRELVAVLAQLGLEPLFDAIVSREDAGIPKPDPTPYLMGAAAVGIAPEECMAVEDSPPGIEAALVARIPAAAVLTNFPRKTMENPVPGRPDLRPTWIGSSMTEFFGMLRSLRG